MNDREADMENGRSDMKFGTKSDCNLVPTMSFLRFVWNEMPGRSNLQTEKFGDDNGNRPSKEIGAVVHLLT